MKADAVDLTLTDGCMLWPTCKTCVFPDCCASYKEIAETAKPPERRKQVSSRRWALLESEMRASGEWSRQLRKLFLAKRRPPCDGVVSQGGRGE